MPKYYCDYCDTYLTHDSPSVRKTHCQGRKHKENVRDYYQKWMEDQAQKLIDQTTAAFKSGKPGPSPVTPGGVLPPPPFGMPPRPPGFPPGLPPLPFGLPGMPPPPIPGMPMPPIPPPGVMPPILPPGVGVPPPPPSLMTAVPPPPPPPKSE